MTQKFMRFEVVMKLLNTLTQKINQGTDLFIPFSAKLHEKCERNYCGALILISSLMQVA